ncbi:MAG: thiamine phosphate synthase [Clostridiaceae bacterium]|nr:thiamine phosphate synthase [Clostridiaceae bacterium]
MFQYKTDYSLYLVTDSTMLRGMSLEEAVEQAVLGGVTIVQLREKNSTSREFYETAVKIKEITDRHKIPLIINDRLDIALSVDAAGVHLGQKDLPCKAARHILGKHKIIGVSAATPEEALKAQEDGADYIGAGAVFGTNTKTDTRNLNIATLKEITGKLNIPVVAIGGINSENAILLKGSGIKGFAVASGILAQSDIYNAARSLRSIINSFV